MSELLSIRSTHHQSLLSGKACFSSLKFKNISVAMMIMIFLLMTVRTTRIWSRKDQKLRRSNKKLVFLSLPKFGNVLLLLFLTFSTSGDTVPLPPLLSQHKELVQMVQSSDKVQKLPSLRKPLLATRKWFFGSAEEHNFVKLMMMFVK